MAATWTQIGRGRSYTSQQAATEAAPVGGLEGIPIERIGAITFWIQAAAGQAFAGDVGQFDLYQFDNGVWGLAPGLVLPVPPGTSGQKRVQIGTVRIDNPRGRVAAIANGVSVSGGLVTLEMLATTPSFPNFGPVPA